MIEAGDLEETRSSQADEIHKVINMPFTRFELDKLLDDLHGKGYVLHPYMPRVDMGEYECLVFIKSGDSMETVMTNVLKKSVFNDEAMREIVRDEVKKIVKRHNLRHT